jgi:integrase
MARRRWSKCLPIDLWPIADRTAWQAALELGDAFDPGGAASRWSPATRRKTASGYGAYLFWLQRRGEFDPNMAPGMRVTRERVARYLEGLRDANRGHTLHNRIQELGDAMRAIAPESDWRWLLRAAGRLRANATPVRDKRGRWRPIEDLVADGFRFMAKAECDHRLSELARAALYRDGLIMAFLGLHPMRLRNLASLRIGQHLVTQGEQIVVKLAAGETKGHRQYEAIATPRLCRALQRCIRHHRPVLLKARGRWHAPAGDALWISRDGSPCSEETFANIIRKRTARADRQSVSPHLFRSAGATSVAIRAPESVDIIPAILTHGSPKTAERYYNLAGSLEASRAHNALLDEILRELDVDHATAPNHPSRGHGK